MTPTFWVVDAAWWAEDGEAAPAPVVMVAAVDPAELTPAVRALLPPDANLLAIVAAVRLVAEGLLVLPDAAVDRLAVEDPGFDPEEWGQYPVLTPREKEVLQLLAAGAPNKIIARNLEVSVHTVKFHVASLLRKLGAGGRLEAVGIGLRAGLLML
jgi:DNA-binding NarL/FixJ family response regulator